eukprot:1919699-Amphidinium_carterae.1
MLEIFLVVLPGYRGFDFVIIPAATVLRRGITLPEGRILVPNVLLETPEACAADYQKRMLAFFKDASALAQSYPRKLT